MDRRFLGRTGAGLLVGLAGLFGAAAVQAQTSAPTSAKPHRMSFDVSSGDPAAMNLVLNNVTSATEYYKAHNEEVQIEIVAFGPGYLMLRDISPVKARIAEVHQKMPSIVFSACQNSRRAVARAENKKPEEIAQLPEARDIPAGVVRLNELQEAGWSYIRP